MIAAARSTRLISLLLFVFFVPNVVSTANKAYPKHWGEPPMIQTMDLRSLPAGYGEGSSTKYNWIVSHMKEDLATKHPQRVVNSDGPWPELVGMDGEVARQQLLQDAADSLELVDIVADMFVTTDWQVNRVRLFVDGENKIIEVPSRG
eukprot:CAMPEP_0196802578 /NCGR_PEP_ID=MMETSP1362-20130617/2169_1 /TAXON_ID=163516 /ORGANISM="Leptocylindrus danicus, Strain CCMP1856" /LENGTH=147 /DNA_ID=CAMNT_0042173913 /DNA_START=65 /DNA_END=508 /DNA_ORIENTATION=-